MFLDISLSGQEPCSHITHMKRGVYVCENINNIAGTDLQYTVLYTGGCMGQEQ